MQLGITREISLLWELLLDMSSLEPFRSLIISGSEEPSEAKSQFIKVVLLVSDLTQLVEEFVLQGQQTELVKSRAVLTQTPILIAHKVLSGE